MAKRFGLLGYPLVHSFSKKYFTEKFEREGIENCIYENFERKEAVEVAILFEDFLDLKGLNVTIPHKQSVIQWLESVDDVAKLIGAVNCIKRFKLGDDFELRGYNTDVYGFEKSIAGYLKPHHQRALILGTGGSSRAAAYVFQEFGIDYSYVSRNPSVTDYTYGDLDRQKMNEFQIIVNCTPFGMFPGVKSFPPIPYEHLSAHHLLFDLVYNPAETEFLRRGKAQGASVSNGMEMLKLQAEKSWEIWNS